MKLTRRLLFQKFIPSTILSLFSISYAYANEEKSKTSISLADPIKTKIDDVNVATSSDYSNGTELTQRDLNQEVINIKSFGAKGDYSPENGGTDNTKAFQKAAAYCSQSNNRKLYLGRGNYLVTDTIKSSPFLLEGEKGCTKITAKNMSEKVVFDMTLSSPDVGRVIGAVDIELIVEGANVDCFLLGPKSPSFYFEKHLRYFIKGNYCHGTVRKEKAYGFSWDYGARKWFRIGDCIQAIIIENCIQGTYDLQKSETDQFSDIGIELDADAAVLSARIHDNNIGPIKNALNIVNRVFFTMHDNDIIGTLDGLIWSGEQAFGEPKIHHNNFNSQRYGIYVKGANSLSFNDNTIRRHRRGWKKSNDDWYGFRLERISDLKISGNTVQADESNGFFSNKKYAYYLDSCSLGTLEGNFIGVGCEEGIVLRNCTGFNLSNTVTAQNEIGDILFHVTENTRKINIHSYSLVSSFKGKDFQKDDTKINEIILNNLIIEENDRIAEVKAEKIRINNGFDIISGPEDPQGSVSASKGSLYLRSGDSGTPSLYVKISGSDQNGWKSIT